MAILDDLEGFLGAEAVAKLKTDPAAQAYISKVDDVYGFYTGERETPPAPIRRETPPEPRVATGAPGGDTLAAIMARLDGIGDIKAQIKAGVDEVVNARGQELRGGAVADSIKITRELSKLDARHQREFGEDLDDDKLSAHIEAAKTQGRPFRTVSDAYEDMTREARVSKLVATGVETGVREKLKERASNNLPGVSPTSASPMLRMLRTAGKPSDGDSGSHLSKAARALEERLGERGEQVA